MSDIKLVNTVGNIVSLRPLDGDLLVYGTLVGFECYQPLPRPKTERDRALFKQWIETVIIPDRVSDV